MTTTYRTELKELKNKISELKKQEPDNRVDRLRKEVRIEDAEERILFITGQTTN